MQCLSAMTPLILFLGAVGCLNNDCTVMSKPYAWRPLGLLPILKATAMTNGNEGNGKGLTYCILFDAENLSNLGWKQLKQSS